MRLTRPVLLACAIALALAFTGPSGQALARPAPGTANPTTVARPFLVRYFNLVEHRNLAGLRRVLSPAFQLVSADGGSFTKAQFLKHLPTVIKFTLSRFHATRAGSVIVVRYLATVEGVVNGKRFTPGPAPRLSVLTWNGVAWKLIAHSNFNALKG